MLLSILFVFGSIHRPCEAFVSKDASHQRKVISRSNLTYQRLSDPGNSNSNTDTINTVHQEWDANRYQKQHNFVWEYGSSLIDILDPQPGECILDVGCGTGELTKAISNRGATCMGMDADLNMVNRAKEQFPDMTYFQGYAQNFVLEYDDDGHPLVVDAIFSNAALHWVKDADDAVAAMSRVLKPGGRFVVEFGGKGNVHRIVEASLQALGKSLLDNPWYFPSIAQYSTLLENHDIEVMSAVLFDRPTVLEDGEEGMKNWLRMFGGAFFRDLQDKKINQVLKEVDETLRPDMFDGEQWTADYRRIRILGKKLT